MQITSKKMERISEIRFIDKINEDLKNKIISMISEGLDNNIIKDILAKDYFDTIKEINEYSNIQLITKNKSDEDIEDFLNELIDDHMEQTNLKKIESLEQQLINNLDESSYSELLELKTQLNRE